MPLGPPAEPGTPLTHRERPGELHPRSRFHETNCCSLAESNVRRSAGGANKVVTITRSTIAENSWSSTTPRVFPAPANTSPTSPRGIIPKPTARRFIDWGDANPLTTFPTIATTVNARPTARTFRSGNVSSFTCIPIQTKNKGTTRDSSGVSSSRSERPSISLSKKSFKTTPAANAPTMAASPTRLASQARRNAKIQPRTSLTL
jgi:hypothetical protein